MFVCYPMGMLLFCHRHKVSYSLPFGFMTFFPVLLAPYFYYLTIMSPFIIFTLIWAVGKLDGVLCQARATTVCVCTACFLLNLYNLRPEVTFVFQDDSRRQNYYDISHLMSLTKNPKVMFNPFETGCGILANSLPACKYWSRQNGALPEMLAERKKALRERKPDFIIENTEIKHDLDSLGKFGYVFCGKAQGEYLESKVYCKKELYRKLPHVKITLKDLLLKKKI